MEAELQPAPVFSVSRVRRALSFEEGVYAEVGADDHATGQALMVVLAAALAEGLGRASGLDGLLGGLIEGCLRWTAWALALHGAALALGHDSRLAPMFRALGFAAAPFLLGAFQGLPLLGTLAWLAKWVLGAGAFVMATRAVLGVDLGRSALLTAIGLGAALAAVALLT